MLACSSDYLDTNLDAKITNKKINQLAEESPEALLAIAETFDVAAVNGIRTLGISGLRPTRKMHNDYGQKSIDMIMDIMGQDMIDSNAGWWYDVFYNYTARTQDQQFNSMIWGYYYAIIKAANQNVATLGSTPIDKLSNELKYVLSRSRALRGFCYFQLIQIYQKGNPAMGDLGVPIIDPTADLVNTGFGRNTVADVYKQIEDDLNFAYKNIDGFTRENKSQINKNVVAGLLARYSLLRKDYSNAAKFAKEARANVTLDTELYHGFQYITNPSWIWGAEITEETKSYYGSFFAQIQSYDPVQKASTPGYPGQIGHHRTVDKGLHDLVPNTDKRKKWFGKADTPGYPAKADMPNPVGDDQIYQFKFYDSSFFAGDYVYMRAAEMYLIEAEALAESGDSSGAAQVLFDLVSTRDTSYAKSTKTGNDLIEEIHNQRRIELWGEGFGLLDLKRWGKGLKRNYAGSTHLSPKLDIPAGDNRFTFQIPESEIQNNDAISQGDQNP